MAAINTNPVIPIVPDYYYLDILLTNSYKNLGQYENVINSEIIGELTEFDFTTQSELPLLESGQTGIAIITGYTTSKLNVVKTYTGEYKVGVNGVTFANSEYVSYVIAGITYLTYLDTGVTLYGFAKQTNEFETQLIFKDDNSVSVDVKKTLNAFIIDRSNISIYDYFNKISTCDNLDDILDIF